MTLGDYLRTCRTAAGLSQREVETRCPHGCGITQAALSRWERNVFAPSTAQLGILAMAIEGLSVERAARVGATGEIARLQGKAA